MAKAFQQMAETIKNGQRSMAEAGQGQPQRGRAAAPGGQLASGGQGKSPGEVGTPSNGGMGPGGIGNGGNSGRQEPLNHAGRDELVSGRTDAKQPQTASFYIDQPDANPSTAAAYAQSPEFLKQTEAALRREQIPPTYRRRVKDYFDSIRR
jgi:hypothetical protein